MALTGMTEAHRAALAARLPDGVVGEVPEAYRVEPRGRFTGTAHSLARPRSVDDVSVILEFASEAGIGVVPYGGGTGLVGGQTPQGLPCLLLSLERMNRVRALDTDDNVLVAEAGAILKDVQDAAEEAGRLFPLSLGSEGSARLGGLLGTNAGGVQVLRYGNARDLCLGLEAVMADGRVMRGLKRLRKDNTGYDLRHLLIGSEGTLGVITAASLKLFPLPGETATAFAVVTSPEAAISLLRRLQERLGEQVSAFELIHRVAFDFLAAKLPETPLPFAQAPEWSVLTEVGGGAGSEVGARLEAGLADAMEAGLVEDALIAQSGAQAAGFWEVRERIPEANRLIGSISSHDISVPVSRIPEFIARGGKAIAALDPELRINCFGHVGDGNLHYNVFPPEGRDRAEYEGQRVAIKDAVHDLVVALEGSISAEHGIGRLKAGDLERYGDPVRLEAMRAIKAALDPKGILNPGAVLRDTAP